ncbi:M28 family metallopeptidase [Intrasporangium sp. YIM S08009]|uniref:M28 family metallopeptidase n=1 Tax=Intrasporangium zincisolvens TaxID=3080018 RepID=UPI002B057697|nr:M28 family metallopeptidase [Intrasporangium sp. YIM S08009]
MRSRALRSRTVLTPVLVAATAAAGLVLGPTTAHAAGPDISVTATKAHLDQLQSIATANGGNRSTGKPGYKASVDYVKARLDAAGYATTVQTFSTSSGTSYNLVADLPGGDTSSVVMFGAHLDSVAVGPGINDNGSGSAGILETALEYAASGQTPRNHVRFGFWGAEELGLLGSKYYVGQLTTAQRSAIRSYQNFDMIASPNRGYFVYDDNAAGNGIRDDLTAYYDGKGIPWEYIDVQGRSDHAAFRSNGLPTGGIFSGAEEIKTSGQAQKWGGSAGQAFDACYHRSCDTSANLDLTALDVNVDAIGAMVWAYAAKDYGTTPPPTGAHLLANPGFESGSTTTTLATYSNVGANATWVQRTLDLSAYRGQSVSVRFLATEDSSLQTSFVIDDAALTTS